MATLVIVAGLPGTGKSTLAEALTRHYRWPLLAIDDLYDVVPGPLHQHISPFWETLVTMLLDLADRQLAYGNSVIIDCVFMGDDRAVAQQIAARQGVAFAAIHTMLADESLWQARVEARRAALPPEWNVATWERIQVQRRAFAPWAVEPSLVVDTGRPFADVFALARAFIDRQGG